MSDDDDLYPEGASDEDKVALDEDADRLDLEFDIALEMLREVRGRAKQYVAENPTTTVLGVLEALESALRDDNADRRRGII